MKIDLNKVVFRRLDINEINKMLELQNEVLKENDLNKETLRQNTYEDFALCFNERSLVLGAFFEEIFVGYGILLFADNNQENLAFCLDDPGNPSDYANIKVIVIRNGYRGNGLQIAFLKHLEKHAKEIPVKTLLCTVSPKNDYSNNNFDKCGYYLVKTVKKYGGLERYLYRKDIQ